MIVIVIGFTLVYVLDYTQDFCFWWMLEYDTAIQLNLAQSR